MRQIMHVVVGIIVFLGFVAIAWGADPGLEPAAPTDDDRVATAEKKQAEAEQKAEIAEEKVQAAKDAAAKLRTGKLLEYGITGGVGFAVQIPLGVVSDKKFKTTDGATMGALPYVAFFPAYWLQKAATNKYCASEWSLATSDAQPAADAIARSQAAPLVDSLLSVYEAAGGDGEQAVKDWINKTDDYGSLRDRTDKIVELIKSHEDKSASKERSKAARRALEELVSAEVIDWTPGVSTNCWSRRFGIFVGLPLEEYSMGFEFGGASAGEFDVSPIVAWGVAFAPNAYLTFLAGVSYSTADVFAKDNANKDISDTAHVWQAVISIGGTLDIATIIKEF